MADYVKDLSVYQERIIDIIRVTYPDNKKDNGFVLCGEAEGSNKKHQCARSPSTS